MPQYEFDRPVFIIGAARSGTTVLGQLLSTHPEVAYWLEPKYIWRYGNARSPHDMRDASEASEAIRQYIRKSFNNFMVKEGKRRFIEKTPSNVFRIPFICKVFPEALFIHIVRDGRDVCLSAEKKWTSRPDRTALVRRLKSFEIPLSEVFYYVFDTIRDVPGRLFFPAKGFIWGPRFKGIQSYRESHSVIETCAMQWVKSMEAAENAFEDIDNNRICTIRYEDLIQNPERHLNVLCQFAGFEFESYTGLANILKSKKQRRFSEDEKAKLSGIMPIIKNTLHKWGYQQ